MAKSHVKLLGLLESLLYNEVLQWSDVLYMIHDTSTFMAKSERSNLALFALGCRNRWSRRSLVEGRSCSPLNLFPSKAGSILLKRSKIQSPAFERG